MGREKELEKLRDALDNKTNVEYKQLSDQIIDINKILKFLESCHDMANREDWSESQAQEMIVWGSELYNEFIKIYKKSE
jgi:hypothetical protein